MVSEKLIIIHPACHCCSIPYTCCKHDDNIVKGDVGSVVFNILVIIAMRALFAGQIVQLSWWPIFRDSQYYYIISIGALILTLYDGTVR